MHALPRAILFDLDDTLLAAYARPDLAWLAVAQEFAAEIAPVRAEAVAGAIAAFAQDFWADPERHRVNRQDMTGARRAIVAGGLARLIADGQPGVPEAVAFRLADRFTGYRDEQMRLHDGAHDLLDALKARGVRLALITNGNALGQRAKIERFELAHRFDHIQIEGEHGFGKPEEQAYRHALAVLGVEAADAWIVGDNLEWEVAAPQRIGLYAIWCDHQGEGLPPGSDVKPDRIIRSLAELLEPAAAEAR